MFRRGTAHDGYFSACWRPKRKVRDLGGNEPSSQGGQSAGFAGLRGRWVAMRFESCFEDQDGTGGSCSDMFVSTDVRRRLRGSSFGVSGRASRPLIGALGQLVWLEQEPGGPLRLVAATGAKRTVLDDQPVSSPGPSRYPRRASTGRAAAPCSPRCSTRRADDARRLASEACPAHSSSAS